ncbi:MAG: NfeD family protein [Burkholderiales bacterium RIFCSPLOWO2_02_FULL_57_36]|nr:MAG: NfeD family protein [Burkholderiales bacterium RIFCSPLOWO2_02_FULL_57_36]
MSDWIIWFVLAAVLVILEMATGTFYLLMLGVALAAGGIAAWSGFSAEWQLLVAAVVGAAAIFGLRKSRFGKARKIDTAKDPNVNLDVGQTVAIEEWTSIPDGACTARVMYRGALWNIELAPGSFARPGSFIIREVRGNRLIVSNNGSEPLTSHSQ